MTFHLREGFAFAGSAKPVTTGVIVAAGDRSRQQSAGRCENEFHNFLLCVWSPALVGDAHEL